MDFLELARTRCSVRRFKADAVEADKVGRIVEAAHVAPTAANRQPVRLYVLQNEADRAKLAEGADAYGAPLVIVVCVDRAMAWERPADGWSAADTDAAILTDHMMLQAASEGLGSVWICWFDPDIVRSALNIPDRWDPVNILAIGRAAEPAADPCRHAVQRIPVTELVAHGGIERR